MSISEKLCSEFLCRIRLVEKLIANVSSELNLLKNVFENAPKSQSIVSVSACPSDKKVSFVPYPPSKPKSKLVRKFLHPKSKICQSVENVSVSTGTVSFPSLDIENSIAYLNLNLRQKYKFFMKERYILA